MSLLSSGFWRYGLVCLAASAALSAVTSAPAVASSHREAPFITRHPKVDGTDLYMFRSYEAGRQGYVTLLANYVPLQDAYGGPNYFQLDPDALYEIHIDNNGDNREDITFQFRFKNNLKDIKVPVGGKEMSIPLINAGGITSVNPGTLNVNETYTLDIVRGDRRKGQKAQVTNAQGGSGTFIKPVDNIGNKSLPDYAAYASQHIYNIAIPGCSTQGRVFVGQRKEPFQVNLGEIFDLVNIPVATVIGRPDGAQSTTDDKNITTLALEVPINCLTNGSEPVIGGWTTASLRQGRLLNPAPGSNTTSASLEGGPWVQVSRLGHPLVNELVIGLKDKDKFNSSQPKEDGQFADYVTNPTLPFLLELLYKDAGVKAPTLFPRSDLVTVFLTGVPGVNKPAGSPLSEMLRLNTALPVTAPATQNRLGAAGCFQNGMLNVMLPGCDPAGFPNGRRPGDDVVDIELRVAMGYLLPIGQAPSGQLPLTDGALVNASQFDNAFPYLKTPIPGSPNGVNGQPANPPQ
ncbi:MAG: DUF4331 domain-containing protein [Burkholderiales bacterium]